jgi:hypothetical protein
MGAVLAAQQQGMEQRGGMGMMRGCLLVLVLLWGEMSWRCRVRS